ncbi:MAG: hypothetical protein KIT14_04990 [bacterium]|nr:hypothetical protein [bacterium]
MRRLRAHGLVLVWALVTSADPERSLDDWQTLGEFPTAARCEQARGAALDQEATRRIGALALTEVQNPVRASAYARALQRVDRRFRCVQR